MKNIKWKILLLTCGVCLLPVLLGMALWSQLPDMMAIHFDIYNEPDNFASRSFVVFGLPCLMALFQAVCCVANDVGAQKRKQSAKIEFVLKWIIPVVTFVLYVVILGYGLDWNIDIRKCAMLLVGLIFLVTGNYMPKLDYIKNYKVEAGKARRINRFLGYECVAFGLLAIASIFFPPIASVVWIILLVPCIFGGLAYGWKVSKNG